MERTRKDIQPYNPAHIASTADGIKAIKDGIIMASQLQSYQLLSTLPETITKDQFYRVCHISKRHAKYLLDAGLVKCVDSGKKTRKYKIQKADVLDYLIDREVNPEKYRAPAGYYIGNGGKPKKRSSRGQAPASVVIFQFSDQEKPGLLAAWERAAAAYADLMTTTEVCELTGYREQTVYRWCRSKSITGFNISGKLLISKLTLLDFLAGDQATAIVRKSSKHLGLLRQYAQECHDKPL